jgi:cation diffusion facilitator CzcD-associated flavoprotein CzcO
MSHQAFKYLVLGGGHSGIITVGKLLDKGVKNIAWVDQHFSVGRLWQCTKQHQSQLISICSHRMSIF